jgi:sarcosine oxidase subunit gamma
MADLNVLDAPVDTAAAAHRRSPAAHLASAFAAADVPGPREVSLRELPFRRMVSLRAQRGTAGEAGLSAALGTRLPDRCGAVAHGDGISVLWLSPDEFLTVSEEGTVAKAQALREALGSNPGSVIDVSTNRTTFALTGPSARAVLEKGCPLDLHPRAFATGTAYVTTISSVPVILWRTGEEAYAILPRSSFADFLGRWLLDAMVEFAAPEVPEWR